MTAVRLLLAADRDNKTRVVKVQKYSKWKSRHSPCSVQQLGIQNYRAIRWILLQQKYACNLIGSDTMLCTRIINENNIYIYAAPKRLPGTILHRVKVFENCFPLVKLSRRTRTYIALDVYTHIYIYT